jgi:ParB-like chromosome segregation protein Spo0J
MTTQNLRLADIVADDELQLRAAASEATVAEYADAITSGAIFPPVIVYRDEDGRHWLADGFHRYGAHKRAGVEEIAVEVREGGRREALLCAAGANASHGLRRTQEDKRNAILRLLSDPEWKTWSDREIARRTSTSDKTVAKLRKEISGAGLNAEIRDEAVNAEIRVEERKFTTKHGTEAVRRVETVGKAASMLDKVLAGLPDEVLLAEVKRRGLIGEGAV